MKRTIQTLLTLSIILLLGTSAISQDLIMLKNGEKISCIIKELSDTQVKYVEVDDANEVIFAINRGQVREIMFAYGKTIEEQPEAINEAYYTDDHKSNIKLNFLSIGADAVIFTYERALNPYSSFEITPKILGVGFNDNSDDSGFGLDLGYKLKLKSIGNINGYRPDHLLHGSYLRIGLGYGYTKDEDSYTTSGGGYYSNKNTASIVHFGLDIGKQWIIQNRVSLDLYAGIHYYGGSFKSERNGQTDDYYYRGFNNGDIGGDDTTAGAFGFRIGFLFEKNGGSLSKSR